MQEDLYTLNDDIFVRKERCNFSLGAWWISMRRENKLAVYSITAKFSKSDLHHRRDWYIFT